MQIMKILLQNTLIFFCFANQKLVHDWVPNIKMPSKLCDKKSLYNEAFKYYHIKIELSVGNQHGLSFPLVLEMNKATSNFN